MIETIADDSLMRQFLNSGFNNSGCGKIYRYSKHRERHSDRDGTLHQHSKLKVGYRDDRLSTVIQDLLVSVVISQCAHGARQLVKERAFWLMPVTGTAVFVKTSPRATVIKNYHHRSRFLAPSATRRIAYKPAQLPCHRVSPRGRPLINGGGRRIAIVTKVLFL